MEFGLQVLKGAQVLTIPHLGEYREQYYVTPTELLPLPLPLPLRAG